MTTVAVFSDVHGNLTALQAVLADVRAHAVDRVYCLGDLVGYGPDPNGVIDTVREEGIPTIMGNYDEGVGFDLGHCGCFYPDAEAKRIGAASYEFTSRTVTAERKTYLRELPRELRLEIDGLRDPSRSREPPQDQRISAAHPRPAYVRPAGGRGGLRRARIRPHA